MSVEKRALEARSEISKNVNKVFGKPDIVFMGKRVAIFCDSEFWHGHNWDEQKMILNLTKNSGYLKSNETWNAIER